METIFQLYNIIKNYTGVIFLHNLGSFDGYFIYKALLNYSDPVNIKTIIDDQNKFVQISFLNKIIFKDSYRIFDVCLEALCEVFNIPTLAYAIAYAPSKDEAGKLSPYNPEFNDLSLFNKPDLLEIFIKYSIQDSVCLYDALEYAQRIYILDHGVDITSIVSTSTLSLKIFRTNYLDVNIPTLKGNVENFIRKGYLFALAPSAIFR